MMDMDIFPNNILLDISYNLLINDGPEFTNIREDKTYYMIKNTDFSYNILTWHS